MVKRALFLIALVIGVAYSAPGYIDMGMATDDEIGRIAEDSAQRHGSGEVLGLGSVGGVGGVGSVGVGGVPGRDGGVDERPVKKEKGGDCVCIL
ncbi:hypothetical protein J6590_050200 [Homalodisca vitripennis]|nr:hypothetical protein J6590_050200 [Homalodisca vitripennis]